MASDAGVQVEVRTDANVLVGAGPFNLRKDLAVASADGGVRGGGLPAR